MPVSSLFSAISVGAVSSQQEVKDHTFLKTGWAAGGVPPKSSIAIIPEIAQRTLLLVGELCSVGYWLQYGKLLPFSDGLLRFLPRCFRSFMLPCALFIIFVLPPRHSRLPRLPPALRLSRGARLPSVRRIP